MADQASLDAAMARAEASRKRAADFESASYFPGDWESAEGLYATAGGLPRTSAEEVRQAAAGYDAAADAYDGAFRNSIPLYAQDREDEITAARDTALASGLADQFPQYLLKADRVAVDALDQYEKEDFYGAKDSAAQALAMYQALKSGADAYIARQTITNRNFASYDPDNFNRADTAGLAAVNDYDAGNIEQARDGAEEAKLRYNLVLKTGWPALTAEKKATAGAQRQNALDVKANVAVRDSFNAAAQIFNEAETALRVEKYEEAVGLYEQSEILFLAASRNAEEKRRIAEEAIRTAEEKMIESDETAKKAELILEGGV
ncbi:MAG: hypothetical protein LBG42_00355 [Treponema sp.]|nr:hypothetical protein [Treponema sp.]